MLILNLLTLPLIEWFFYYILQEYSLNNGSVLVKHALETRKCKNNKTLPYLLSYFRILISSIGHKIITWTYTYNFIWMEKILMY